jgi:hypothetical protein
MDMLSNSEISSKNIFIIFHEQDLAQFFILDRLLIFHTKDPNKIEIRAIRSLAGLQQGQGGKRRRSGEVAHRRWIGGEGGASGGRGGSQEPLGAG